MTTGYQPSCANCGHSHTYDGPLKPLKLVETPCWKCGCEAYSAAQTEPLSDKQEIAVALVIDQAIKDALRVRESPQSIGDNEIYGIALRYAPMAIMEATDR